MNATQPSVIKHFKDTRYNFKVKLFTAPACNLNFTDVALPQEVITIFERLNLTALNGTEIYQEGILFCYLMLGRGQNT